MNTRGVDDRIGAENSEDVANAGFVAAGLVFDNLAVVHWDGDPAALPKPVPKTDDPVE